MPENTRQYHVRACGLTIHCQVVPMGRDYTICIWSGQGGHVGSAAMAVARPSLTGTGRSATTSVLNALGHKDDAVAGRIAAAVAKQCGCTAVCTCGIHADGLTPTGIQEILDACGELEKMLLRDLPAIQPETEGQADT